MRHKDNAGDRFRLETRKRARQVALEQAMFEETTAILRRFGADAGEGLSAWLEGASEPERLAAVGEAIIDCGTGAESLAAARRIAGAAD